MRAMKWSAVDRGRPLVKGVQLNAVFKDLHLSETRRDCSPSFSTVIEWKKMHDLQCLPTGHACRILNNNIDQYLQFRKVYLFCRIAYAHWFSSKLIGATHESNHFLGLFVWQPRKTRRKSFGLVLSYEQTSPFLFDWSPDHPVLLGKEGTSIGSHAVM
jgi:hypothetical protein